MQARLNCSTARESGPRHGYPEWEESAGMLPFAQAHLPKI